MDKQLAYHIRYGLLLASALVLLIVSVGGPLHAATMPTDHHGQMVGCPLMLGKATLCPMNLGAHLALWRTMFIAVLPLVLGGAAVILWLWLDGLRNPPGREGLLFRVRKRSVFHHRGYVMEELTAQALHFVRRALATGVLHPKIYLVLAR